MALSQSPIIVLGAALTSLLFGCTDFVGAGETSAGASGGITTSGEGPTAGSDTPNPTAASGSASGSSTSTTSGPSGITTEDNPTNPAETTSGVGTTTSSEATTADTGSLSTDSGSDSTSTSASSSSSTGEDPADLLGMSCEDDGDCAVDTDQECCTADQCLNTCMVPCSNASECPELNMGCEHGYCLFPCNNNDEDCSAWPGYTCQHDGMYCESD